MSDRRSIFNSIFIQYLETFSSHLGLCLENISVETQNLNDTDISNMLNLLFSKFPRIIPLYSEIIGNLALVAINDPEEIISFLTKSMKEILLHNSFSIFAQLQNFCVNFDINNGLHVSTIYYFSLFFLSDLLCQIVTFIAYNSSQKKINHTQSNSSATSYSSYSPSSHDTDNFNEPSENATADNSKTKTRKFKFFHSSKNGPIPNTTSSPPNSNSSIHSSTRTPSAFSSTSISNLTRAGYNLATATLSQLEIQKKLIHQWSVIFSILSEKNFEDVYQLYSLFSMTNDLTLPILLYRYIRFDVDDAIGPIFFTNLMTTLKTYIKKKTLNNCILESVSTMLITLPYDEDIYQKLFNLIYPLRKDKNLSNGASLVLTSIFIRYKKTKVTFQHFFDKRILAACSDKTKTQTSADCFFLTMLGRNVVPEILFWEFGNNPILTPLSFIKFSAYSFINTNQGFKDSFHSAFMNHFFAKSDFNICPGIFMFIIVYLASLNFKCFVENVVPKFLELNDNDPRFIVLLNSIPKINSDDFFSNCFSKIEHEEIEEFNRMFREKVINAFLSLEPPDDAPHGVCIREVHFLIDSLSDEADQKVSEYLNEWGIASSFKTSDYKYQKCKHILLRLDLSYSILNVLRYVLIDEDYSNTDILRVILKFSCSINNGIASSAYRVCTEVFPDKVNSETLIKVAFGFNIDNEFDFIVNTIIFQIFKKQRINKQSDEPLLRKVEILGFFLLASALPVIRNLAQELIYEVYNILGERSMFSYIERDIALIEKMAKTKLIYCQLPHVPQRDLPPASIIPFHSALMSHYYDVWLFYFAEILNVLILRNFSPLTEFCFTIRKKVLQNLLHNENKLFFKRSVGHHIILLSNSYHVNDILNSKLYDADKLYKPFDLEHYVDHRAEVATYLNELLHSSNESFIDFAFGVIRHLHFSLLPSIMEAMTKAPQEYLLRACSMVGYKIRTPDVSQRIFNKNIPRITNFLTEVQFYLMKTDFSRARKIDWTTEIENKFVENEDSLKELCYILIRFTEEADHEMSEINLPTATREIICRYILNWTSIKAEKLESLRMYSDAAYNAIASVGPSITSQVNLPDEFLLYLSEKSTNFRSPALYNLLHFHFELLFDSYIRACITLPRVHGDAYFSCIVDCIISCTDGDISQFVLKNCGKILFVTGIYFFLKHPKAKIMIRNILKVLKVIPGYEYLNEQYLQIMKESSIVNIVEAEMNCTGNDNGVNCSSSSNPSEKFITPTKKDDKRLIPNTTSNSRLKGYLMPSKDSSALNSSSIELLKLKSQNVTSIDDTFYQNSRSKSTTFGVRQARQNNNDTIGLTSTHLSNLKLFEKLPDIFSFATEGVFDSFFNTIKMKNVYISLTDATESVHPWLRNIRLLPNRSTCANDVPSYLNYFTPYEFLTKLLETTEMICEDNLRSIILMWLDLSVMPDHVELIPCFLNDWDNQRKKRMMYQLICEMEPSNLMVKFSNRYTFVYYYYITQCLKRSFDQEQEMLGGVLGYNSSNLNNILHNCRHFLREKSQMATEKDQIKKLSIELIHFSFLFYNQGARKSFNYFCSIMEVQNFEGTIPPTLMRAIAREAIKWFPDNKLEAWGNEALKWLFGCKDIKLATISFLIYNNIMKPFNKEIIQCVIRTLSYHVSKAKDYIIKSTGKNKSSFRLSSVHGMSEVSTSIQESHLRRQSQIQAQFQAQVSNSNSNSSEKRSRSKSIDNINNIKLSPKGIKSTTTTSNNDDDDSSDDEGIDSSNKSSVPSNNNSNNITDDTCEITGLIECEDNFDEECISPLCQFISETFIFMKKALDLLEDEKDYYINVFFQFISAFFDCRIFVDSVLAEATPVIMEYVKKCFSKDDNDDDDDDNAGDKKEKEIKTPPLSSASSSSLNMTDKQTLIAILRPRLKKLMESNESQVLLSQFINYLSSENDENDDEKENKNKNKNKKKNENNEKENKKKNDSKVDLNIRNTYDELIMIALPIKMINPRSFQTVKFSESYNQMVGIVDYLDMGPLSFDYNNRRNLSSAFNAFNKIDNDKEKERKKIEDTFFDSISDSALCKSLVHYSTMIQTDSLFLQNILFYISTRIVERLEVRDNENNKLSLAKIYQQALRTMTKVCAYAVDFIQIISSKIPNVVSLAFFDYYEWERSIEDVDRNVAVYLKKYIHVEDTQITITDCKSYSTVKNFLFIEKPPQILPFVTYEKLKNGMKFIKRRKSFDYLRSSNAPFSLNKLKRSKKKNHNSKDIYSFPASMSIVFNEDDKKDVFDVGPLIHPEKLIMVPLNLKSLNVTKIKKISVKKYLELESDESSYSESD